MRDLRLRNQVILTLALLVFAWGADCLPAEQDAPTEEEISRWVRESMLGLPVGWRGDEDSLVRAISWGVEQRIRWEYRDGIGFDSGTDDAFILSRTRAWVEAQIGNRLSFHVEGRDARQFGDEFMADGNPLFEDNADLFQAYVTARIFESFKLRVGREILAFDDQRLVGGLLWTNTSRSFDAIHGMFENERMKIDFGVAEVVTIRPENFNKRNEDDTFYFLHATAKETCVEGMKASGFLYARNTAMSGEWKRDQYTAGARLWGQAPDSPYDYDFTGAFQFGEVDYRDSDDNADIRAFALHGEVGRRFAGAWKPRVSVEGNWASGDDRPDSGTIETFDHLYPTNHAKYGIADLVGWKNQRNIGTHLQLSPCEKASVQFSYFAFWLDAVNDSLYNAGGASIVSNSTGSNDRFAGHEFDGQITYQARKNVTLSGGLGWFFPGDYVRDNTESGDDFIFGFLETVIALN
jgi:hypothetical protein